MNEIPIIIDLGLVGLDFVLDLGLVGLALDFLGRTLDLLSLDVVSIWTHRQDIFN